MNATMKQEISDYASTVQLEMQLSPELANRIRLILAARFRYGLGLKEAKHLVSALFPPSLCAVL